MQERQNPPNTKCSVRLKNENYFSIDLQHVQGYQSVTRKYVRSSRSPARANIYLKPYMLNSHIAHRPKKVQVTIAKGQLHQYSFQPFETKPSIIGTRQYVNMSEVLDNYAQFYMPKELRQREAKSPCTARQFRLNPECIRQKLSQRKRYERTNQEAAPDMFATSRTTRFYGTLSSFHRSSGFDERQIVSRIRENARKIQTILQEQNIETDEHSEAYKSRAQSATQRRWPAVSKLQKTE